MATVYTDLIPREVANEAIAAVEQESVCLTLGNVIRMSEGLESVPVVSLAPVVDFVTPTYGGRKPMTTIEWTSEQLQPVELAATLSSRDAFRNDAGFPVWHERQAASSRRQSRKSSTKRSCSAPTRPRIWALRFRCSLPSAFMTSPRRPTNVRTRRGGRPRLATPWDASHLWSRAALPDASEWGLRRGRLREQFVADRA